MAWCRQSDQTEGSINPKASSDHKLTATRYLLYSIMINTKKSSAGDLISLMPWRLLDIRSLVCKRWSGSSSS